MELGTEEKKSIDKEVFCLMPWIHFHLNTDGKVRACCSTSITYGQLSGETTKHKLANIWNGRSARTFRKKLLAGEKDKRCEGCYQKEAAGKSSMRTETLSKFPETLEEVRNNWDEDGFTLMKPTYLDLRFSNICNLRCRTCWHGASSSWFEEAKIIGNNLGEKAIISATTNNFQVLSSIMTFSDELEEVYFAGGEPILMEEHYQVLKLLLQNNRSDTLLRYNTNLSVLSLKDHDLCDIWQQFSNVKLSISIDGIKKEGSYIRKGLNWERFIANIEKVMTKCPHVSLELAPTISILNIYALPELHQYFVRQKYVTVDAIYLNLLNRPSYYNIQTLPPKLKQIAKLLLQKHIQWLESMNATIKVLDEYHALIEYMFQEQGRGDIGDFIKNTTEIDELRDEKLSENLLKLSDYMEWDSDDKPLIKN